MSFNWAHIESGATFHALVGNLLLHEDPLTSIFNRDGADGAIDALSGDRKTVFQSKHHKNGAPADAIADANKELAKIRRYRQSGHRWHDIWSNADSWTLVTNVPFGPAGEQRWRDEIVPAFAAIGLIANFAVQPKLEEWLARHTDVADAFFGRRTRLFVSLAEHREALVQREVLERSYDIPLEGRTTEIGALKTFVKADQEQVKLVHGPGGTGKSRLLYETARQLVEDGTVETVYSGTPNLAVTSDWYVGIVPEAKALVILDEPTDRLFMERFLAELRTRTKQWKVLIAARTPRDPVVQVLTDPRERLLAPALELRPLPEQDATRYAEALLAPLAFPQEHQERAVRWLVDVCGGFPIWMTVAVHLLEDHGDLTTLPADKLRIAAEYVRDILDHTRPEVGGAKEVLSLLRWIALIQPINRTAEGVLAFLADRTRLGDAADVDRAIEDLARRRVVTAYGMDRRLVEVRPDVLRDHLLIDWLTCRGALGRQPSSDARAVANGLASAALAGTPTPFDERIVTSLGRMEFLVEPTVDFLGPVANAAVRMAAEAADTEAQERAIAFASPLAFVRPLHLAQVVEQLRTRDVTETVQETMFGRHSIPREEILDSLPWELFTAARGATAGDERRYILSELAALADEQGKRAEPIRPNSGNTAIDLISRILHEQYGYRSSFCGEAVTFANGFLDNMARGQGPTTSGRIVIRALLEIERHDTHTDEADEHRFVMERFRILPAGELGRIVVALRERLWAMTTTAGLEPAAARVVWELLVHLNGNLNRASDDEVWNRLLTDDLMRCRSLVTKEGIPLQDLQAARAMWEWHLEYGQDADRKLAAEDCEAAYLAHPVVRIYAPLFGSGDPDPRDRQREAVAGFPSPIAAAAIEQFLEGALLFTSSHAQQWRGTHVHSFAWLLGELRGAEPGVVEFVAACLRKGPSSALFRHALSIGAGRLRALRTAKDVGGVSAFLDRLGSDLTDEAGIQEFLSAIYGDAGPWVARELGHADYAFLERHWSAFIGLPIPVVFLVLGRFLATEAHALAISKDKMIVLGQDERRDALSRLWLGYFETLPHEFVEADVSVRVVDHLLELSALLANLRDLRGNSATWEIRQLLERVPRKQLSWLVDVVRTRIVTFGGHNRRCTAEEKAGHVFLLPSNDSVLLSVVEQIPDRPATDAEKHAIVDLLGVAAEDWTIDHGLPDLLVGVDPHGRAVPAIVVERIENPLQTTTKVELVKWSRFAGWYGLDSPTWRRIAIAACNRAEDLGLSKDDRAGLYSSLTSLRGQSWSGSPKELHPRWQQAVGAAQKSLSDETEAVLRTFWEWRLNCAQGALDQERGRFEERF